MERRQHTRTKVWLPVEAESLENEVAVVRNVSTGGALVVTASELTVGASISVFFRVPGGSERHEVVGKVVRVTANDADPDGAWPFRIAIAFDKLEPELAQIFHRREVQDDTP